MSGSIFGIDLGTNNIKIYNRADDSVIVEKNMIAIENKNTLFAYGDSAYEMYEKAPANIHISYPLNNGVIADIKNMATLIKYFIGDIKKGDNKPSDFIIAVPTDITEVEKRAFYDLIKDSGIKTHSIKIMEKAVADGLGNGIDVKNAQGVLVVNVGYETTEISILSLGGLVLSKLIKVGGLKFDDAIRQAVRREQGLLIGVKTAESVKINLRELKSNHEPAVVYGRDIVTGLPVERTIPVEVVDKALNEHFRTIIDNVKVILERTPPELSADIYRQGVYLTGGASQVSRFAESMYKGTGLKVNQSENPMTSVALGISKVIKEENYRSLAYSIEGMSR
ncbi:rod shape-determining protein MreB [Lachnospiraceae bacterium G11]|nr:rod shape-determining protein MreB [Lachnospiraceae bacterium G11]